MYILAVFLWDGDGDGLDLGVVVQAVLAALPSDARLLEPAEWRGVT